VIIDVGGMNGARINRYETPLIRKALKSNPAIIYHSKSQIDIYKQAYPELVCKSKFILFGVDTEYFTPQNTKTENFVLSFGFYKRDYHTLIRAWDKVISDTKLKIIGIEGKSTDSILYPGKFNIKQLKEEIAKSLFVVVPLPVFNYSYGQMSFLQSMSMGKPVIVTRTPSSSDYLIDGHGSYYVKPYDADDLAEKINILLSKKEILPELGLLARQQTEEKLNEKIMARSIYEFLKLQLYK
jgi:glycosyltransferase involved in cell wall biosynthesis